jgi:hypothetical protein
MSIKFIKISVILLAIFLWIQAYSPLVYKSTGLFPDDYRNGDLYRLSYLPQFKENAIKCSSAPISKKFDQVTRSHLYIIGDSFTEEERVSRKDFPVEKYSYIHWAKQANIQLDTLKRNILILETVERTFKEHFVQEANNFIIGNKVETEIVPQSSWKGQLISKIKSVISFCFPDKEGIEQRFEHTLFNYDFFLNFRETKAMLNQKLFGRVEKKVVLSKNEDSIFYSEEADSTDHHSAFYPLTQSEIDLFVKNINQTKEKYLKAGFDEVYLSIIPNKVSVVSPDLGKYNHLIERIETDKRVQTPLIKTYEDFKKSPQKYYLKSDTHWNCEGRNLWLEKVILKTLTPQ